MTREEWLRTHAFLEPVARLLARAEAAAARIDCPAVELPQWGDYADDYEAGFALLHSGDATIDLAPAGAMTLELLDALAASAPPDRVAADARDLRAELGREPGAAQRVADSLLGEGAGEIASPGLLRFLGWTAARRYLQPVLVEFARWRNQDRWQRSNCPVCGALPAMAQLIGVDPGRIRFLSCGCCHSRWRYRRTACPFCEGDSHRIQVLAVEGEGGLRIDHCEACRGYLKTYAGQGSEDVMLADWTSLHLDVLAQDRGLERKAASLYSLDE
ncbi:MAG TPA: formate dehydrogenase accessory protein FdhE [Planctomycetota bacterium]|nr:formate dehydrogenase accessory protein FdhE [Planctomycetota bacterium]